MLMVKHKLIESIRQHNPSAEVEFLLAFSSRSLMQYLEHLRFMNRPRGAEAYWVRPSDTPAMVSRAV